MLERYHSVSWNLAHLLVKVLVNDTLLVNGLEILPTGENHAAFRHRSKKDEGNK